jgi:hypothetical protein
VVGWLAGWLREGGREKGRETLSRPGRFEAALVRAFAEMYGPDPAQSPDLGRLISPAAVRRVQVRRRRRRRGRCWFGGGKGFFRPWSRIYVYIYI